MLLHKLTFNSIKHDYFNKVFVVKIKNKLHVHTLHIDILMFGQPLHYYVIVTV